MQMHVTLKQTSVGDSSSHAWQNSPPPRSVRVHADGVQEAFAQPESASAAAITKSCFISSPARTRLYQGGLRAGADVGTLAGASLLTRVASRPRPSVGRRNVPKADG